jgi:hypothetical protein
MWPVFLYLLIVEGGIAAIWLLAAAGIGRTILKFWRISSTSGALNFATSAGLGLGTMSLVVLAQGLCGALNRGSAIGLIVVGLTLFALSIRDISNFKLQISNPSWLWLIIVPTIVITIVGAFILPGVLWGDEPHGYDVLEYHLQVPREWYELGRIVPLQHNVFSYFPFNVEMHYLLAMELRGGPWAGMYLAQLMHFVFVALTVMAVYGAVESIGAKPQAARLSAIIAASVPWMGMLGAVAYDEGGLLLFGTLAIAWVMQREGGLKHMILAGALAGLACGAKLTAVPMVLLAVPVTLVALCLRERARATAIRGALIFIVAGLVTYSPWMIRNTVWAHNPIFPEGMRIVGHAHFSDVQVERWERAHSPVEDQRGLSGRIRAFRTQVVADWRYGFVGLPIAIAAIMLGRGRATFLTLLLMILVIIWIGFTHLQGRFLVPAIPIAAILVGLIEWGGWKWVVLTGATVGCVTSMIVLGSRVRAVAPALGAVDSTPLLSDAARAALGDGRPIALIGDARAFWYQIPMSRLSFRTVFNVNNRPGESVISAWAGDASGDAELIVDPGELRRLTSYWQIPKLEGGENQPYLINGARPR